LSTPRIRQRPLLRTLSDTVVFVAALAMVIFASYQAGWLSSEQGNFTAVDGDSLRKGSTDYRLHAIDAPEIHQSCKTASGHDYPCGREAHQALRQLVSGQTLECRILETDRYRRLVSTCIAGTLDINAEMVRQGWAVAYKSHGIDYVSAESEAIRARRGIWQGHFQQPEKWRAEHRNTLMQSGLSEDIPPD
jgi:endonuclease YncB( thermonuclease family)